ncbi:HAMP domain-containing protein [Pontibacter qinzhouensis]|uniref:histidine kinase n=1 Tax=Pontibacter qinzhouensis TaxID=2603253 RepID=A0A5C8KCB5_9BACT|nr:ATP-binding protein [Pontibacter qinzhouensis]TXK51879.1 HAMP domain-containing protein [Pontibacter qinzhouensis]
MKIRTKLTLQFTTIFALILLLFSLVIYYFNSLYRKDDFYERIERRAHVIATYVLDADEVDPKTQQRNQISYYQELPYESAHIYTAAGELIFSNGDQAIQVSPETIEKIKKKGQVNYEEGARQLVGITFSDNQGQFVVVASSVDAYNLLKMQYLKYILIGGWFGSLVVVLLAGWAFAKEALRPITKVVSEVEKISASELNTRLSNADGKDEVSQLAQTFNNMLNRLELAFDMQRTFVSNASHELRTPLTTMIGELEVALMSDRDPAEYKRVLQSNLEDARLLTELSNGLLQIAQASIDPSKIKKSFLRFDELVWQARDQAIKRNPAARFDINFNNFPDEEDRLVVKGNEALLLIAFLNVLENAVKFSPEGHHIVVLISVSKTDVLLKVKDEGLGIAAADLKHVFIPFFRAGNVRNITGHGIGLPLTDRILKLHAGHIRIESIINRGTEVTISLPQAYGFIPNKP